jgi:hypothetical protein
MFSIMKDADGKRSFAELIKMNCGLENGDIAQVLDEAAELWSERIISLRPAKHEML